MNVKTIFSALVRIVPNIFTADKSKEEQYYNNPDTLVKGSPDPKEISFSASYTGGGTISDEEMNALPEDFPSDRMQRYRFIKKMKQDPIINTAIKFHTSSALSWNEEKGVSVTIKPRNPKGKNNGYK